MILLVDSMPVWRQFSDAATLQRKVYMSAEELCSGKAKIFTPVFEEILSYKFKESPNYSKIIFMLAKIIIEEKNVVP